ncbi:MULTISPECIES: lysine--tRNA ligase [Leptospirillum]|uniref:Lysine--tRNA ligase n=2 Tax=Leptospirillum ferriphilum TaxID=178606 RepID=A0A059XTT9_9BACT|nr:MULTISPECIES: lysine--tRNA ligase [Leptospirillum]EAY56265.1 MAG: Lysyl-tRNA synthetase [Leptospirillum rubarum]EIJ75733.1 MAG: Lysyl-tRNA synthetase [Leptospirillum sp. Group II 'C75']AFS53498.1 lysyl-tRNA synthetase [Leptospirillum ferriphilum ML-04]AIA30500.1 lysine--tRNA ligase [Leptospirillum ferriphilum YSK]AKS23568.1 lysine--tRNA ligase [Leptospirillum sp. Group II 'CF-1']
MSQEEQGEPRTGELTEQERVRRQKRDRLAEAGIDPYGAPFPNREPVARLMERISSLPSDASVLPPLESRIAGRVVLLRRFGKAFFATLQDASGRFQIYVRKDHIGEEPYALLAETLDIGDHLGVEGTFFRTKTGEPTLDASHVTFLGKSVHPLPEKWHGLTDIEQRYRQRYIDLIVNPDARDVFVRRGKILGSIRRFMEDRGFMEVETPMMHPSPGGALARPFVTHHNALDVDLYLRIAPELYLKRLMVGGFDLVFEINRNFRNEGFSPRHNPEFTMMEFYMAYHSPEDLMALTESLFDRLAREIHGDSRFAYGEHRLDFAGPYRRLSYFDALTGATGLDRASLFDENRIMDLIRQKGLEIPPRRAGKPYIADLQNLLFEEEIEKTLIQPTFVTGYPRSISPLARSSREDPEITDRFELFVAGVEIANGFMELNDPDEQLRRFLSQQESRNSGDLEAPPPDMDYIRALEIGLPPTAGEGIGIDRLVMLLTNQHSIRDVLLFPQMRPQ